MKHSIFITGVLLTFFVSNAFAGDPSVPSGLRGAELAAGYEALMLCSDTFVAHMPAETIHADDLPGWRFKLGDWPVNVDTKTRTVAVKFDASMPPRVAVWRRLLGCAQLPIGAKSIAGASVPRAPDDLTPPTLTSAAWPLGDKDATEQLPEREDKAVASVVSKAFDGHTYGDGSKTSAVIVLVNGRIVAERYGRGITMNTPQRTWSMAKSLVATTVGRAVQLGLITVAMDADVPEWRGRNDPRHAITINDLLRMNSGLWTRGPGNITDSVYWGGGTVPQTAAVAPIEVMPGTRFNYANDDFLLAMYSVTTKLGSDALAFPFKQVLWPLGMLHTTPETDWQGHFVMSSQVWMTARDSARLALAYENDGVVGGKQFLPRDWLRYVSSTSGAQPDKHWQRNGDYGAGFWVYGPKYGLPTGTISMSGSRGQYAVIVPSAKVIVVRRGFDARSVRFGITAFVRDLLDALGRAHVPPR